MGRPGNQQGMALIAVIAVLIALVLIATPFLMQMQNASKRAEGVWSSEEVDQEAKTAFNLMQLFLLGSTEPMERENAANKADGVHNTPDWDTLAEFELPIDVLQAFNQNSARGRIWDVRVEDEQAKINVNSASYHLLANMFGATELSKDLEEGDTTVELVDGSMLPEKDGVVRVGFEQIRYRERQGNVLDGVERGVDSQHPWNMSERTWKRGTLAMNAVAFEIATYPIRREMGQFTNYRNPYQVRRVSELGTTALEADSFDHVADSLTCWSGRTVAAGWCNAQTVKNALPNNSFEELGEMLEVDNSRYYGPGTIVRITDGTNTDYGVVLAAGPGRVLLGSRVADGHEFSAGKARVETLSRHPINVNTASVDVLTNVMANVALWNRDRDTVDRAEAAALANHLVENRPIQSLYHFRELLREAEDEGLVSRTDTKAIYRNALNPCDVKLRFSTVPFSFKSYDVYTIKATAVVNSRGGEEVARKTIKRVVSVNQRRSAVWSLESQRDFEEHIVASRDAKRFTTFPYNVGGTIEQNDLKNIPPSRFSQHFNRNIWPSPSREPGIGDIRLMPRRLNLEGVFHYDDSDYSDGHYIRDEALTHSAKNKEVQAVDEDGMEPVSASFWLKPQWGGLSENRYFFDTGEETWQNRCGLFYDASNQDIVFRLADNTLEQRAVEIRHPIDPSRLEDDRWYHVSVDVNHSYPGGMSLLVDGRAVGEHTYMSRLSGSIPSTGEISSVHVDNAESFPDKGALLVLGEGTAEVIEYDGKSGDTFTVTRRFARQPLAQWTDEDYKGKPHDEGDLVVLLGYSAPLVTDLPVGGATLASDLGRWHCLRVTYREDYVTIAGITGTGGNDRGGSDFGPGGVNPDGGGSGGSGGGTNPGTSGGGTNPGTAGGEPPFTHNIQDTAGGGNSGTAGGSGGGTAGGSGGGTDGGGTDGSGGTSAAIDPRIYGIGHDRATVTLTLGQSCEAWDSANSDDAMAAFGNQGYAILVSFDSDVQTVEQVKVGGWEFVKYTRNGNSLDVTRYQKLEGGVTAPGPYFAPMHTWGSPDAVFITATALIPISVEGSAGGDVDYLDPMNDQDLKDNNIAMAWIQVNDEWMAYTYPDAENFGGSTVFVWDDESAIKRTVGMFGNLAQVNAPNDGGDPGPIAPGGDDGGTDPVPPDGGDPDPDPEPPAPPDPDDPGPPPGEDDGGPGDNPPPPVDPEDPGPPPGEDDGGPGDTPPPAPDPEDPGPPPGEDDGGPGDNPPPPVDPEVPGPVPGEDDGGPGDFPPQPEPPVPGNGGEDDTGPGDGGGGTPGGGGGEDPPPDGGEGPPDDGDGDDGPDIGDAGSGREPEDAVPPPVPGNDVPFSEYDIAGNLDHRPWGDGGEAFRTLADTEAESHLTGDEIIPCFLVEQSAAGRDDRVTVATLDDTPEELRLNHNYWQYGSNWVAAKSFAKQAYESSQGSMDAIKTNTIDPRKVVRLIKFPSGELPRRLGDNVVFGGRFDGGALSKQFFDELYFRDNPNEDAIYLGKGDTYENADEDTVWKGIDEATDELYIHHPPTTSNPDGLPIRRLPEDGGILLIHDEIIAYEELDTASGRLTGVRRGIHGTEPDFHSFKEIVAPVEAIHMAVLQDALTSTSPDIQLNKVDLFPKDGGYVLIDDEIIGYTEIRGNTLVMPTDLNAVGPEADNPFLRKSGEEDDEDSDAGGGIFRGRFGTVAMEHAANSIVYFFPARHPDRYRERSVDPETSAIIVTKRVDGAIWKRVSWDEKLVDHTDIKVLARFDGTPAWDSDNIYSVDQQMVISGTAGDFEKNPKSFLFLVETPHAENRMGPKLGIQADRIELRFGFEFKEGAFSILDEERSDSWKDTPWVKSVRVEYVAPVTVHYTESPK